MVNRRRQLPDDGRSTQRNNLVVIKMRILKQVSSIANADLSRAGLPQQNVTHSLSKVLFVNADSNTTSPSEHPLLFKWSGRWIWRTGLNAKVPNYTSEMESTKVTAVAVNELSDDKNNTYRAGSSSTV
eukprot:CFRG1093T1